MNERDKKVDEAYRNLRQFWTAAPDRRKNAPMPSVETLEKIARFVSPGDYFFYIFNLATAQIEHASTTSKEILGIAAEDLDIGRLLSMVHPDQLQAVQMKEATANTFFTEVIPPELMNKYKMVYTYKVITAEGKVLNLLHQSMPIHENEEGNYRYTLNIDVDITEWNIPINNKISFISRDGKHRSYYNIDAASPDFVNASAENKIFSSREIEVLDLVAMGKSNAEIAEALGLSSKTIDTHRKNMLQKSGHKTINQLVANCVREGII